MKTSTTIELTKVSNGFVTTVEVRRSMEKGDEPPASFYDRDMYADTSKLRVLRRVAKAIGIEGKVTVQAPPVRTRVTRRPR